MLYILCQVSIKKGFAVYDASDCCSTRRCSRDEMARICAVVFLIARVAEITSSKGKQGARHLFDRSLLRRLGGTHKFTQ